MISDPMQLVSLVDELTTATWTLAAVGTLFESGLADAMGEPRTLDELAARVTALPRERIERCLAVAESRGLVANDGSHYTLAPGAAPFARPPARTDLLGEIRSVMMQSLAYVDASTHDSPSRGWYHTNPRLLQAQGDSSVGFAGVLRERLAARLGLDERLAQPSARFLDVGVGVGALSIAMCRAFPAVRAVGLDVFDVPLAIARENVVRAELVDRVELRQLAVEDLRDEAAYDLAWLPACFLPPSSLQSALARIHAALRPGGWVLMPTLASGAPDQTRRIWSMVLEQWGSVTESDATRQAVDDAGFAEALVLPGPGWVALVAGRK